jgi:hypothetical protein
MSVSILSSCLAASTEMSVSILSSDA